jgi:hypothetical protein
MAPRRQDPLTWSVPITDKEGRPTEEFQRKWAQQFGINESIPDLSTATLVSAVIDKLGTTRGAILYRNATVWTLLIPATDGKVLTTHGAGADPTWEDASAVTDIQTLLDTITTDEGDIIFRSATAWEALSAGATGYVLTAHGVAPPTWEPPSGVAAMLPLVTGDLPGPALMADDDGQCIGVPL